MLSSIFEIEDEGKIGAGETAVIPVSPAAMAAECRARASVYRLLSGVFVEEAAAEFLAAIRADDMLRQLAETGLRFDDDFVATPLSELVETLAIEYASLFVASGGFPPVESVRLYGRYKQEPEFATMQTYRRLGFVLQSGRHEVFADQLGVELMFVAALLERQAARLDDDEHAQARELEKEIKRFWTQHLGRWARGYGRLVERAASHSFYREMGRFLAGFAEEEIRAMGLRVEDADQARLEVPKAEVQVAFDPDEPVCNGCASEAIAQRSGIVSVLHDLRV